MRWTGQIFWLLAFGPKVFGLTSFPPSPRGFSRTIGPWEVVSSYSSATAPDSHGISCADPHPISPLNFHCSHGPMGRVRAPHRGAATGNREIAKLTKNWIQK